MSISITHISTYLPQNVVTNELLAKEFGSSEEQIFKNTGIRQRYSSAPDEISSDMAVKAAETLFEQYQIDRNSIDFLIFCTEGFDHKGPSTSCLIQHRLGLGTHTGCIDLPYGCSGYVYGIGMANALLTSLMAKKVLFLTADIPTKVSHKKDLELRSIFSDIGTATIITKAETDQHFIFGTDGGGYNNLIVDHSGCRNPQTIEKLRENDMPIGHMKMNSTEIFLFAVKRVPGLVADILKKHELSVDDIDLFVFHQASYFMLDVIRRKCKIPKEKFFINIENFGNSVSSTIPVALKDAEEKGVLKKGMKVMVAGFGIGYSWGATIMTY
ncbi:MAG: ketoacyl-ACP synthase III [Bacteroidota bacterium]